MDYKKATSTGFMRLFQYIQGANAQQKKVEMAAPVLIRIDPGEGPNCESNFKVNFYFPNALQSSPTSIPQPTEGSGITITRTPAMKVAVASYGGWASGDTVTSHVEALGTALTADSIKFKPMPYFSAGYDAPFKIFNRHNEVWMLVQ